MEAANRLRFGGMIDGEETAAAGENQDDQSYDGAGDHGTLKGSSVDHRGYSPGEGKQVDGHQNINEGSNSNLFTNSPWARNKNYINPSLNGRADERKNGVGIRDG